MANNAANNNNGVNNGVYNRFNDAIIVSVMDAIKIGDLDTVRRFIENGGDVNSVGRVDVFDIYTHDETTSGFYNNDLREDRLTPNYMHTFRIFASLLDIAVKYQQIEIVDYLLHAGAKVVDEEHKYVLDPLITAIRVNNPEIVFLLIRAGANPKYPHFISKKYPLWYAALQRDGQQVVNMLIDERVNKEKGAPGETPLMAAAEVGNTQTVILLVYRGAKIEGLVRGPEVIWTQITKTPLFLAIQGGHLGIVRYLIARGANIHFRAKLFLEDLDTENVKLIYHNNNTALHFAVVARANNIELLKALLNAGVDPNIENSSGFTPIELAINLGKLDEYKYLKSRGLFVREEKLNKTGAELYSMFKRNTIAKIWSTGAGGKAEATLQKEIREAGGPASYYGSWYKRNGRNGRKTRRRARKQKRRSTRKY